ncbi:MAG: indole-3-glycerol phosphate synthase [Gammaproteobacteria bacterium]|jgi:indole-3-glycerol phosphate synthase|nr:indole-3-glycerol phosphate synthase [Gammaproteobacteria bacterium]
MSADFLEQMAASSRERVAVAKRACSEADLLARALASPPPQSLQRDPTGFDLIAELKLRSPAAGQLKSGDEDLGARVTAYARAGAAVVSVLTEPSRFDGSMAHLELAVRALAPLGVPAMRKDFLVDPYQVTEARLAGAGGVLVILRMLPRNELDALIDRACTLGLFVLLEAFDADDIELMHEIVDHHPDNAHAVGAVKLLAGVNCRDLATLQIVPLRLIELAHLLPTCVPRVAESGVGSTDDARRVAAAGYEMALVGSALMQGGDPGALANAMLEAGRAARSVSHRTSAVVRGGKAARDGKEVG